MKSSTDGAVAKKTCLEKLGRSCRAWLEFFSKGGQQQSAGNLAARFFPFLRLRRRSNSARIARFVMADERCSLFFGKITIVFWIVNRALRVGSSEAPHRFHTLPQGHEHVIGSISNFSREDEHIFEAFSPSVFLQPGLFQIRHICLAHPGSCLPLPDSCDHDPRSLQRRRCRRSSCTSSKKISQLPTISCAFGVSGNES